MLKLPSSRPTNTLPLELEEATADTPETTVLSIEADVSVDTSVTLPSQLFPCEIKTSIVEGQVNYLKINIS
jgi:hypothetical protein